MARAQVPVLADSLGTGGPAPAVAVPPRLVLDLTTATRNAYLMRVPDAADDHGYLATQLTYCTRWGLYAGTYLNHSYGPDQTVFDDYETTLGYAHTGNTEWNLQYTHLSVPGSSQLLRATITDNLGGSIGHDLGPVYASLTADAFLGSTRDVVLTWNVSRTFPVAAFGHDTLSIAPTAELGTGTQRYYAAGLAHMVREQVAITRKNGRPGTKTVKMLETPNTPGFALTGYSVALPITLEGRGSSFALVPTYLVPLHVPEWGNPAKTFYVSAEFTRRFW